MVSRYGSDVFGYIRDSSAVAFRNLLYRVIAESRNAQLSDQQVA